MRRPLRRRRGQRGQILVETAIIMPIMIFFILGALQLVVLQHAKVVTHYAAYCAARAGVVHNADANIMRNAAMVAALPIFRRTDDLPHLVLAWAEIKIYTELTQAADQLGSTLENLADDLLGMVGVGSIFSNFFPDTSIVDVEVTSPTEKDFEEAQKWQEKRERAANQGDPYGSLNYPAKSIDFDDQFLMQEQPRMARLALETRILVPLKIPIINWIFFQLWYAQTVMGVRMLHGDLQDWTTLQARLGNGQTLEEAVEADRGSRGTFDDALITSQRFKEAVMLGKVARDLNVYLIPLRASYAMQMQSNPFWSNRRNAGFFDLNE